MFEPGTNDYGHALTSGVYALTSGVYAELFTEGQGIAALS